MGRLIDADALAEGYKHMGYDPTEHPEESYLEGWCKGFNAAVDHCMYHVIHAPTIEERKTGRWEDVHIDVANDDKGRSYRFYSCTACGVTSIPAMLGMKKKWLHFCPNCGAKMEDCEA